MAHQKKVYACGQSRGGVSGVKVDTAFGAPGNLHKSKRRFKINRDAVIEVPVLTLRGGQKITLDTSSTKRVEPIKSKKLVKA